MRNTRLEIRLLSGAGGAEISGVDVALDLDDETIGEIRDALNEHCVVFFRNQELDAARHKAFARRFGEIFIHPNYVGMGDDPEIVMVRREPGDTGYVGEDWHADTTMWPEPPMGAILYGIDVPRYGGDTMFANQYLAYETLSKGMRTLLDGLIAVNSSANADVSRTREDRIKEQARTAEELASEHPVVRTHPETGRKALYVNVAHTARFEGMTKEESAPLLNFLFQHQVRAEFTCRFQWRVGSLAFWDNRCTQHNPINDYHGHRRLLHRITLEGDVPR